MFVFFFLIIRNIYRLCQRGFENSAEVRHIIIIRLEISPRLTFTQTRHVRKHKKTNNNSHIRQTRISFFLYTHARAVGFASETNRTAAVTRRIVSLLFFSTARNSNLRPTACTSDHTLETAEFVCGLSRNLTRVHCTFLLGIRNFIFNKRDSKSFFFLYRTRTELPTEFLLFLIFLLFSLSSPFQRYRLGLKIAGDRSRPSRNTSGLSRSFYSFHFFLFLSPPYNDYHNVIFRKTIPPGCRIYEAYILLSNIY